MALYQNTIDYNSAPTCTIEDLTNTWQISPVTLTVEAWDGDWEDRPYLSAEFQYSLDGVDWVLIGIDNTPVFEPETGYMLSIEWNAENLWDVQVRVRATANDGMENSGWENTGPFSAAFKIRQLK